MKRWFLLYAFLVSIALGTVLADAEPGPPQGIDCDSCRYWQGLGETI